MEMHQVRYFLAVCETLNFTRAAERCHVSQPALTRAVKKLEEELGGPLFRRERNHTHLTDLGRMMKPHLEQSLASTMTALATAQDFQSLEKAPLNLGVMCTIGPSRLIGLMSKIRRDLPGIELTLHWFRTKWWIACWLAASTWRYSGYPKACRNGSIGARSIASATLSLSRLAISSRTKTSYGCAIWTTNPISHGSIASILITFVVS